MKATASEISQAIRSLDEEGMRALLLELSRDPEMVEDLMDSLEALRARNEPVRPFDDFVRDLDNK